MGFIFLIFGNSQDYSVFFTYVFVGFALSVIFLILNFFFVPSLSNFEKNAPYECGFDPFEDSRIQFNIHYYFVAILFIVFDAEILFLFPLTLVFSFVSLYAYSLIIFFLFFLTLGFIIEWENSLLKW